MPTLVDSHCHLDFDTFAPELDAVVDRARAAGLVRMVTISTKVHLFAERILPIAERYDGWVSREVIGLFERYVRVLFARYGHRVRYWLTFNEINSVLHAPFLSGGINTAPEKLSPSDLYQAIHHELVASALATRIAVMKAGEIVEIRVLVRHPMDRGGQVDAVALHELDAAARRAGRRRRSWSRGRR